MLDGKIKNLPTLTRLVRFYLMLVNLRLSNEPQLSAGLYEAVKIERESRST